MTFCYSCQQKVKVQFNKTKILNHKVCACVCEREGEWGRGRGSKRAGERGREGERERERIQRNVTFYKNTVRGLVKGYQQQCPMLSPVLFPDSCPLNICLKIEWQGFEFIKPRVRNVWLDYSEGVVTWFHEPDYLSLGYRKGLGLSFRECSCPKRMSCSVSVLKITITAFSADFIFNNLLKNN